MYRFFVRFRMQNQCQVNRCVVPTEILFRNLFSLTIKNVQNYFIAKELNIIAWTLISFKLKYFRFTFEFCRVIRHFIFTDLNELHKTNY